MRANNDIDRTHEDGQQVVGESATDQRVSKEFNPSYLDALNGYVDINVSAYTGTVTFTLQTYSEATDTWVDVKDSAAVAATGLQTIRWNIEAAGDQAVLPLRPRCRVVVTTDTSSSVTVDEVRVSDRG